VIQVLLQAYLLQGSQFQLLSSLYLDLHVPREAAGSWHFLQPDDAERGLPSRSFHPYLVLHFSAAAESFAGSHLQAVAACQHVVCLAAARPADVSYACVSYQMAAAELSECFSIRL
jgi:hypothetical protein